MKLRLQVRFPHNPGLTKKCFFVICFLFIGFYFISPKTAMCNDVENRLDLKLPAPENENHKNYLGLETDEDFTLGQINADILIIEIFSMYCPICQGEAIHVNNLFQLIQNHQRFNANIKMIGIGAGNSSFEVNFFKEKYNIEFPLFHDSDFFIHKKIGEVRTPHFFGLALQGNGEFKVFYSQSGKVLDPEEFLKTFLENSGLKGFH